MPASSLITGKTCPTDFEPKTSWTYSFLRPEEADVFNWPLYNHFLERKLFVCLIAAPLNLTRLLEVCESFLWRGGQYVHSRRRGHWETLHRQLLFRLNDDCFVFVNSRVSGCRVFATSPQIAESTAKDLVRRFRARRPRGDGPGRFFLVSFLDHRPQTTPVAVERKNTLDPNELSLLYGEEFAAWEQSLRKEMQEKIGGTIILRGEPGTGKTSFIRHLIKSLHRTHRFYYLPVTEDQLLSSPQMAQFWVEENADCQRMKKVAVLEDAEELLMSRAEADRGPIANLLNISDGLLGDFLKLQLICTVNCPLARLDPAVVRGGRLIAYREFPRLSPVQAARLAAAHDLALPPQDDYSLAEVFRGQPRASTDSTRRKIGFLAAG